MWGVIDWERNFEGTMRILAFAEPLVSPHPPSPRPRRSPTRGNSPSKAARAGEGYFSADGRQMIFQSERAEGNPFYQMYLLDLETGDIERLSPGHGKTTCGWLHPDGKRGLFASTQMDPEARKKMKAELDFRASGQSRRYSWDYDGDLRDLPGRHRDWRLHAADQCPGLRRRGRLLARRDTDRVRLQPPRLRGGAIGGRRGTAGARLLLLHGNLRHGCGRLQRPGA